MNLTTHNTQLTLEGFRCLPDRHRPETWAGSGLSTTTPRRRSWASWTSPPRHTTPPFLHRRGVDPTAPTDCHSGRCLGAVQPQRHQAAGITLPARECSQHHTLHDQVVQGMHDFCPDSADTTTDCPSVERRTLPTCTGMLPFNPFDADNIRFRRHGYYAAITFMDEQVGHACIDEGRH